ncbi:unnamed protein product [Paramecium octaurelia]|uniref:Uncharacterized protein n=1 Tax=Paramecium octaurelia TaxID=43137 RepID=A0A8S1U501_PAROT|nr:unnamed protein product [Paramecium octaurelia]
MLRPQSEFVKQSQVSPPVQAPTDVIASQPIYKEKKKNHIKMPLLREVYFHRVKSLYKMHLSKAK